MKIDGHNSLGHPVAAELTRLVVRDAFDQPLVLVVEIGPNTVLVSKRGENGFESALRQYGIPFTTVETQKLDLKPGEVRIG